MQLFGTVRLWDSGTGGLWDCETVRLWDCETVRLWDCGTVRLWDCGTVRLWDCGTVGLWDCGTVGLWDFGTVWIFYKCHIKLLCSGEIAWFYIQFFILLQPSFMFLLRNFVFVYLHIIWKRAVCFSELITTWFQINKEREREWSMLQIIYLCSSHQTLIKVNKDSKFQKRGVFKRNKFLKYSTYISL